MSSVPPTRAPAGTECKTVDERGLLARGAGELASARDAIRIALSRGTPEPAEAQLAYERGVAALVQAASASSASAGALRLAAAACAESGLRDPMPFLRRLEAHPGHAAREWAEIGMLYLGLGQAGAAGDCFDRALALSPQEPLARASRALSWLGARQYDRGWDEYEARLDSGYDTTPRGPMPIRGCTGSLQGLRVFVASEQGVGDEVMFASCLPDLVREAGSVSVECSSRLVTLLQRSFPDVRVLPRDRGKWPDAARPGGADCGLWAGSLPRRYRRTAVTFPGTPYLVAEHARVSHWRAELSAPGIARRIGIAWTGGLPETGRARRSIPLAALAPFLRREDAYCVSLELLDPRAEASRLGVTRLAHFPGVAANLDDFAALVASLDVVVAVPGAGAHLAGALGRPVHVLVNEAPTWRYGWTGDRVDWYGSMRVHRREGRPLEQWISSVAADVR